MSIIAKSDWEKLSHEGKEELSIRLLNQAFESSKINETSPQEEFNRLIMNYVDASDKPLSKFLSNNSWWLNKYILQAESTHGIGFTDKWNKIYDTMTPEQIKAYKQGEEGFYQTNKSYIWAIAGILILVVITGLIIKLTKRKSQ